MVDARIFFFCVCALVFCYFWSYSHSFAGELRLSAHIVSVLNQDGSFVVVQVPTQREKTFFWAQNFSDSAIALKQALVVGKEGNLFRWNKPLQRIPKSEKFRLLWFFLSRALSTWRLRLRPNCQQFVSMFNFLSVNQILTLDAVSFSSAPSSTTGSWLFHSCKAWIWKQAPCNQAPYS